MAYDRSAPQAVLRISELDADSGLRRAKPLELRPLICGLAQGTRPAIPNTPLKQTVRGHAA